MSEGPAVWEGTGVCAFDPNDPEEMLGALLDLAARVANVEKRLEGQRGDGEILSCPFCGKPPTVEPWHGGGPEKTMVACESERCSVAPQVTGETREKAIKNWNRRAP